MYTRPRILSLLLLLTSGLGYLAWGRDQHAFLFQAEAEVFRHVASRRDALTHPLVLLPLLGQVLLLITVLMSRPKRLLMYVGIGAIGILLLMILVIGLLVRDTRMIFSTVPFWIVVSMTWRYYRANPD